MTKYEKEVRALNNQELLDRLLFVVERNCFQDILRAEAKRRFVDNDQS